MWFVFIIENSKLYSISAMRYESICLQSIPLVMLYFSWYLKHWAIWTRPAVINVFIQVLISTQSASWHNEQDIKLVVVSKFLYKRFSVKKKCSFVEDFFLMGFCKALSCFCCDINPAVMSIWKSWRKIKPNKKSNKILIDLHVYLIVNVLNHNKYKHCWIINKFNHISFSFSSSLKFLFN